MLTHPLQAQQGDTLSTDTVAQSALPDSLKKQHSVSKATWLSTALPGLGQAYNKKYWKIPIIYGGLAATVYFAIDNHQTYKLYLDAFYTRIDDNQSNDQFVGIYTEESLIELQNQYRKWRDLSILIGGVIYALNIIDAHVDAHLYDYNISKDLSLNLRPTLMPAPGPAPGVGFSLSLNLK